MPKKQLRTIRSFVRREGRLTSAQQRALETLWPVYGIEFSDHFLDFDVIFGRSASITLEIGFGNGASLTQMAAASPEHNFIGIEVHRPGVGNLLLQLEQENLNNVRIICHDAVEVLKRMIPPESLNKIQIFFPDPWPKKKHHKRRLIQPDFINLLATRMKPESILHLATDWENYAEQMLEVLTTSPDFINTATVGDYLPRPDFRPLTKFEQRGQRLGHGVWDLIFQRQ